MSQVFPATRDGKIQMFRQALAAARQRGDVGMVRNLKVELAACGVFETTEDTTVLEHAVPDAPKRGRRPKPRCEHGKIADRCVECNDEEMA